MVAPAHGSDRDPRGAGAVDRALHAEARRDLTHAVAAVDDECGAGVAHDARIAERIEDAAAAELDVLRDPYQAVRRGPPQVRLYQALGDDRGTRVRHPARREDRGRERGDRVERDAPVVVAVRVGPHDLRR